MVKKTEMEYYTVGMSDVVRATLLWARSEDRVIIGLPEAIKGLQMAPDNFLFCFLEAPRNADSATHMLEVLLQAFCFENDIYIIKVDSAKKLSRLLGSDSVKSCALLQRKFSEDRGEILTRSENILVDHCEQHWDVPNKPVIKLPEK